MLHLHLFHPLGHIASDAGSPTGEHTKSARSPRKNKNKCPIPNHEETGIRYCLKGISIALVFALAVVLQCGEARAASFDCARASNIVETLICTNSKLSQMDDKLATIYSAARSRSADPKRLFSQEMLWISQRNKCKTLDCVSAAYIKRINELQGRPSTIATSRDRLLGQSHASTSDKPVEARAQTRDYQKGNESIPEQGNAPNSGIAQQLTKSDALRLPSLNACSAFDSSYSTYFQRDANGAATLSQSKVDEEAVFRKYFGINMNTAPQKALESTVSWIKDCEANLGKNASDYLVFSRTALEGKIRQIKERKRVSLYLEKISDLPKCSAGFVGRLFKSTIDKSPQAATEGIKLLAVKDFKDVTNARLRASPFLLNDPKRFCIADALLNSGEQELLFSLKWFDKDHRQLVMQIARVR